MKEKIRFLLDEAVKALQADRVLPAEVDVEIQDIQIERARDDRHGDFASNVAMMLAKPAKMKPRDLAEKIVKALPASEHIAKVEIAGPGFINFTVTDVAHRSVVPEILELGDAYGRSQVGAGQRVNVEFVSSNPTGPLHVGHGRGAAYGATVSNLLAAAGFEVHREYYVNDAGRQMRLLAASVWLRYLELFDALPHFPVNGYRGDYVKTIVADLKEEYGEQFKRPLNEVFADLPPDGDEGGDKDAYIDALVRNMQGLLPEDDYQPLFRFGLDAILTDIREDLTAFGVTFDEWFLESGLFTSGDLTKGIDRLRERGHLYERDGATWFHAVAFGDEKDRVVIRENGQPTYFASDIAYHLNKYERGFDRIIDIFGADHHGYAPRIRAFLQAEGLDTEKFAVLLVQFAVLYRGKERLQMSTRSGSFVTLRQLRDEVGNDAARFFYIMRKADQHLDFDLELAKAQSADNPVYYIQYAHARICSVFRQMEERGLVWDQTAGLQSLDLLTDGHETELIRRLAQYPETIETAALAHEPHRVAHYLQGLANGFHTYYNAQQFLVDNEALRNARLCLIVAVRQIIASGLCLLGVAAPEIM